MAKLFQIDDWNEQSWWNTGGTRDKKIYLNPDDGERYYFKQSYRVGSMDYEYEFWSEIIAYEVGILLGFDVLPYHIARRESVIGCISKSMINDMEELVEGGKYLQAFDQKFKPEDTGSRNRYDFQLIMNSFRIFKLDPHLPKIIEMLIFDALIGNSDRHQENWAFITEPTELNKSLKEFDENLLNQTWLGKAVRKLLFRKSQGNLDLNKIKLVLTNKYEFSPIYDSGCCFGRELQDHKVSAMLNNKNQMLAYVRRGKAEVHWEGEKISHFELIENLLATSEVGEMTKSALSKVISNFDETKIQNIVNNIDAPLQDAGLERHLPEERKNLIVELLLLRYQSLSDLYLNNK